MARSLYRKLGIGVGVFLTLVAALGLTIYIGGQPLVMRVVFLLKGTTNPLLLLNESAIPAKQIPYGPEPLQFGELRVPDGPGKHPVVILVHGGCWEADLGNLDSPVRPPDSVPVRLVSLELLRPMASALTRAGIATWNIEYRRLGNLGGGWPGTYKDVSTAVDFLPTLQTISTLQE